MEDEHASRVQRRAPGVPLCDELGELAVREDALLAAGRGRSREAMQQRKDVARVERALQRPLSILSKLLMPTLTGM